jgi:hypothetical protein
VGDELAACVRAHREEAEVEVAGAEVLGRGFLDEKLTAAVRHLPAG